MLVIGTLCLVVILVLLIIYIVRIYQTNRDGFLASSGNTEYESMSNEIGQSISEELSQFNSINLPIFLADDGNFCPNWEDGSSCQKLDNNFLCTIVNPRDKTISDASSVPNP